MTEARILVATTNRGKQREVKAILTGLPVQIATLDDYPVLPEPLEDADTFEGNAKLKALHYARLIRQSPTPPSGLPDWALADDSGLEVDALGGEPGVHSARYAGPACGDAENNAKLIGKLASVPPEKRTARFRCVVALANEKEVVASASGVLHGFIIDDARGTNGFGYDPHFFVPEYGMTTAEMPPEQKNRISHRGRALRAIAKAIESAFGGLSGTGAARPKGRS